MLNLGLEFELIKINEICILNGFNYSKNEKWDFINYLDTKNINQGTINKFQYFSIEEKIPSRAKRKVNNDDIIISTVRPNQKHYGLIKDKPDNLLVSTGFTTLTINKEIANPEFIYYYITQPNITESLQIIAEQSTTSYPSVKPSDIGNLIINIPTLNIQKKIGKFLSNFDKKIENLKNTNKKLDKILKEIFKNRFIRFEKYKKSNEMQINDEFGEIPKNWSVEMLEDYVDFISGIEPGSKNYQENKCDDCIPFIRVGDLGSRDNMVYINKKFSKNKLLKSTDIVLSLDATLGLVKIGLNGAYSTGMRKLVIKNNKINRVFLYCLVKSKRIQNTIENFATGTTILHAGKSIKHMNFVLPDEKTMIQFNKIGEPIFLKILENKLEIDKLTKLRDILLPKLMSGEINVSNIKI